MRLSLPISVVSPQDLTSLIIELHDYARWLSHEAIKNRVSNTKITTPPTLSKSATDVIATWTGKHTLDHQSLDALIASLERYNQSASIVNITLAAPAPNKLKSDLANWCRNNLSTNVLVNFQFNATILGGMVIRYGSHVFDWSFRRQLLDNRNKFPEVLRNV